MHLLVLSAFRQTKKRPRNELRHVSMHLLVLSAFRLGGECGVMLGLFMSQCTFWCSVLSDST